MNTKKNLKAITDKLQELDKISSDQKVNIESMIEAEDKESVSLAQDIINLKVEEALHNTLNDKQLEAFVSIINFIKDVEEEDVDCPGVVLKGYAGTGKTYLITRVIEYIRTAYPSRKIAITAPTNKAVSVLYKSSKNAGATFYDESKINARDKIVYTTIHKLLSLKEVIYADGTQKFVPGDKVKITDYKYVILDELSMLDDKLFLELMKYKNKIKFIFLGDPAQIPPVKRTDCIPFKDDCPYDFKYLILDKIMRQKNGNPLVNLSVEVRNNLGSKTPAVPKTQLMGDKKSDGVILLNDSTVVKKVLNHYFTSSEFKKDSDHMKVIAWTNKTVNKINNLVRKMYHRKYYERYGRKELPRFLIGDKLVANKAIFKRKYNKQWQSTEYHVNFHTSKELTIRQITIQDKLYKEFVNRMLTITETYKIYHIDVTYESPEELNGIGHGYIEVIHEDSLDLYNYLLADLKNQAVKNKTSKSWIKYYNVLKWNADVIYNYAITAHKSQGSTYKNCLVIDEDIDLNNKVIERNRIRYTAYTRASSRLFIIN